MIEGILIGLTTALTLQNILMVMLGCFFAISMSAIAAKLKT